MVSLLGYLRVHFAVLDHVESFNHPDIVEFGRYRLALTTAFFIALGFSLFSSFLDVIVIRKLLYRKSLGLVMFVGFIIQSCLIFFVIQGALNFINLMTIKITNNTGKTADLHELSSLIIILILAGILSRIFIEIEHKLGPGNLLKLLSGSYYNPKEVERIFMFIDLKDSTQLAEEMGHLKFSSFIKDCFQDFAVVDDFGAEVYQYVGDEAIVSWKTSKGIKNARFLQAFFAFTDELNKREDYYLNKYGVKPYFKAGVHMGVSVMTEVGEIKKEFCFHGDTLNTTARIQSQCNNLKAQLLMSEALQNALKKRDGFYYHDVGEMILKGKVTPQKLYKIERA
jgi:adenylate cyclase